MRLACRVRVWSYKALNLWTHYLAGTYGLYHFLVVLKKGPSLLEPSLLHEPIQERDPADLLLSIALMFSCRRCCEDCVPPTRARQVSAPGVTNTGVAAAADGRAIAAAGVRTEGAVTAVRTTTAAGAFKA